MLIMKRECERCRTELPPDGEAHICSFECTFCGPCAAELADACPNCGGELVRRPTRAGGAGLATGLGSRLKVEAANLTAPRQVPNVSVERVIAAEARSIFDVLADPARHGEIDGSGTLSGSATGPKRLYLGARFGMGMNQQGVRYTSTNEVVEFAENRLICWQTFGEVRGVRFVGGQKWRYELVPQAAAEGQPARTLVRATYDWSQAIAGRFTVEAMGFPAKARQSLSATLRRLESVVGTPGKAD